MNPMNHFNLLKTSLVIFCLIENVRLFDFVDKLPQFDNYTRRFDPKLSNSVNEKFAFHYYIQQSLRNILRRLIHRLESIKRILHENNLLPPGKDTIRSLFSLFFIIILKLFLFLSAGLLKLLRESAMERFLTTPLEEKEKFEQMKNLSARLSSNQTVIAKLEKELNDAITERDTEVKKEEKKREQKKIISYICRSIIAASFLSILSNET